MSNHRIACGGVLTSLLLLLCAAAAPGQTTGPIDAMEVKQRLLELANKARDLPEKEFSIQSWTEMRFALNDAMEAANQPGPTAPKLENAFETLRHKVDALQPRSLLPDENPRLGLSATLFATKRDGRVDNAELMWAAADPSDQFELQRASAEAGPYTTIYTGTGTSFNEYGLSDEASYYRVIARREGKELGSNVVSVTPMSMPEGLAEFSNQTANDAGLPREPLKVRGTYYDFRTVYEDRALKHVVMRTSTDGTHWMDGPVVMDRNSHPELADCKFESGTIFYDETNDQIVWWCHWELSGPRYGHGKAMVATAKPGEPFKVHHIYNPLGIQVRDMSVFVDQDKQGYLVAASNVPGQGANATIYLFKLNETYDDAVEIVAKVVEGGYREAPHIIRDGGFYYLFFSQAAGWYPSRGGYVSAKSLRGAWSDPRSVGNPSTFSSQSGPVVEFGRSDDPVAVMMGNRWIRGEGTARFSAMPIHFANGFAFYDYAPLLLHDEATSRIVPVHLGKLLSQDRPVESSIPGKPGNEPAKAFDGDYDTFFQSDKKEWPFTLTTDLGASSEVRNVQISWYIHKGSEAYYTYSIEGSPDGREWTTLLDRTDPADTTVTRTYGFTSDILPDNSVARYLRIKVLQAHLHNNPSNWYSPTVYEVKVFGEPVRGS